MYIIRVKAHGARQVGGKITDISNIPHFIQKHDRKNIVCTTDVNEAMRFETEEAALAEFAFVDHGNMFCVEKTNSFVENIESQWGLIDKEMHEVINALNSVKGIHTRDCCFGHPGIDRECNHDSYWFIGFQDTDNDCFKKFWAEFFNKYRGKTSFRQDDWLQFTMTSGMFDCYSPVRLVCAPKHDPGVNLLGVEEKLEGLRIVVDFCKAWGKV